MREPVAPSTNPATTNSNPAGFRHKKFAPPPSRPAQVKKLVLQQQQQLQPPPPPPQQPPPAPRGVRPPPQQLAQGGKPPGLSIGQLQEMARRQQHQIEAQQQLLVAKEQRLKYLRQQDYRQHQMAAEYERLRRLREKVESQELKLRKLRAMRGQPQQPQQQQQCRVPPSVTADLESIRALFNEKEKELSLAVQKVDGLTSQLDELRSGRITGGQDSSTARYPPQIVELERLRRELAYRRQLNEQQNNMIAQQRAQLSMGKGEIVRVDDRISELQDRLSRKRLMNQQLASQISAATNAKQAQLRAMQQGMANKNKNKPVSTVEPFQRNSHQSAGASAAAVDAQNMINADESNKNDPKYQTLPFNTKFSSAAANVAKVEAFKQEREKSDLPAPPPLPVSLANAAVQDDKKPVSSVAPVLKGASGSNLNREGGAEANGGSKPALPPKPPVGMEKEERMSPPPYVPAPPPQGAEKNGAHPNLSVSSYPDEGTSVDDDAPIGAASRDEAGGGLTWQAAPNVHISINRRIEMPPAFHFPEDQTPPSDLLGIDEGQGAAGGGPVILPRDVADNASLYPMMNQIYKEFDHLSTEEQKQISSMLAAAVQKKAAERAEEELEEDASAAVVPDVYESDETRRMPRPKGIIRDGQGEEGKTSHNRRVMFDPLALLLDASLEGELDLVIKTASQVRDPSAANDEGITALHNAICAGHFDIVEFLVQFGCDVNAQDSDGWTPLHCAASCNNLPMVRFLVEHGACIFATTLSDHETAAEKCEEDEEGFDGCSEYLYSVQEKLGTANGGEVFAVYDYAPVERGDELTFKTGDKIVVVKKGDEVEKEWWWSRLNGCDGYVPRNLLGLYARVPARPVDLEATAGKGANDKSSADSVEFMMEESDEAVSSSS